MKLRASGVTGVLGPVYSSVVRYAVVYMTVGNTHAGRLAIPKTQRQRTVPRHQMLSLIAHAERHPSKHCQITLPVNHARILFRRATSHATSLSNVVTNVSDLVTPIFVPLVHKPSR